MLMLYCENHWNKLSEEAVEYPVLKVFRNKQVFNMSVLRTIVPLVGHRVDDVFCLFQLFDSTLSPM